MDKTALLFLSASSKEARKEGEDEDLPFIDAYKDIESTIEKTNFRQYFELHQEHKVSLDDLMKSLEKTDPQIVHFFGHGEKRFLLLENELGGIEEAKLDNFANVFKLLNERKNISPQEKIRCVVLVACNSARIAAAVSEYVECAIGMTYEIEVALGRRFAQNLYYYLGNGHSIKWAFEMACNAIGSFKDGDPNKPVLKTREKVDPNEIYFVPNSFSKFDGTWEGIHLSKDIGGQSVLSRHTYEIKTTPAGIIKGTCDEQSADPPYKYTFNGEIKSESIFWSGEIDGTPTYTWLFNLYKQNEIHGFIFSRDFSGSEFASFLLFSRKRWDDMDYLRILEKAKLRFYLKIKG